MPGDNIYPDLSNSQFDIQYARLMGLPSDLRATLGVIEELPSSVFPGNPPVFETPSDDDTGQFRFAVAAEDNTAAQHRSFDLAGAYKFEITQLGNTQFLVDPTNGLYQLGAVPVAGSDSALSYTYLEIDDTTRKITLQAAEGVVLPGYGYGNHSGIVVSNLGVDASGNLIEFTGGNRFGVAGEDDTAGENRNFATGLFGITIITGDTNTPVTISNTAAGMINGLGSALNIATAQTMAPTSAELNTTPDAWSVTGGVSSVGSGRYDSTSAGGTLFFNFGTITVGDVYILSYNYQVANVSSTSFAGATGTGNVTIGTHKLQFKAINTSGTLTITIPTSGAGGFINTISFKKVAGSIPAAMYHTSGSGISFELRSDLTTGNIGLGLNAGEFNAHSTFAIKNIAIGNNAHKLNTVGSHCIAIGDGALAAATEASGCIAIGTDALKTMKTYTGLIASANIAIGYRSQEAVTTGLGNNSLGTHTLIILTTGNHNTAMGHVALQNCTGSNNQAFGAFVMQGNLTGSGNVAMGHGVAQSMTSGSNNTLMGSSSIGGGLSSGSSNTFIGTATGNGISTGSFNTCIGQQILATNNSSTFEVTQDKVNGGDNRMVLIGYNVHKNTAVDEVTTNGIAIGFDSRVYQSNQAVFGGNDVTSTYLKGVVEVRDFSVLAANTLADPTFPSGTTKWDVTGGFSLGTNKAVFDLNVSSTGTLTQPLADMAIAGKGERWYKLVITTTADAPTGSTFTMTVSGSTFASTTLTMENVLGGGNTLKVYFKSKVSPTDFQITMGGTIGVGSGILNITNIVLTEVTGGDVNANRYLKSYVGAVVLETQFTPGSASDATHPIGSITADDTYIWYRKSDGNWVKVAHAAF